MKKFKRFIITGFVTMMMLALYSPTNAIASGPAESFLDCVEGCVEKYDKWTLRRTACAADCYVGLISDVLKLLSPL